jgi:hypothetical protein
MESSRRFNNSLHCTLGTPNLIDFTYDVLPEINAGNKWRPIRKAEQFSGEEDERELLEKNKFVWNSVDIKNELF